MGAEVLPAVRLGERIELTRPALGRHTLDQRPASVISGEGSAPGLLVSDRLVLDLPARVDLVVRPLDPR